MTEQQTHSAEPVELEALLWAWTNLNGWLPDSNTMDDDEIKKYWNDYHAIIVRAVEKLTGMEPNKYLQSRAVGASPT